MKILLELLQMLNFRLHESGEMLYFIHIIKKKIVHSLSQKLGHLFALMSTGIYDKFIC